MSDGELLEKAAKAAGMIPYWLTRLLDQKKSCIDKLRFSTPQTAELGAIRSLRRYPRVKVLYAYKCRYCKGYHLTKRKKPGLVPIGL